MSCLAPGAGLVLTEKETLSLTSTSAAVSCPEATPSPAAPSSFLLASSWKPETGAGADAQRHGSPTML